MRQPTGQISGENGLSARVRGSEANAIGANDNQIAAGVDCAGSVFACFQG